MVLSFDQRQRLFERFRRGVENKITNFFLSFFLSFFFSFLPITTRCFPLTSETSRGDETLTRATSFEARVPKTFTRPDYFGVLFSFYFSFISFLFWSFSIIDWRKDTIPYSWGPFASNEQHSRCSLKICFLLLLFWLNYYRLKALFNELPRLIPNFMSLRFKKAVVR